MSEHEHDSEFLNVAPGAPHDSMMSETVSYDKFRSIIADQLGVEGDQVTPEASFVDDLNADSLDLVELIMAFEEEYGMEISDEDAEKITTVGQAWDYVQEKLGIAS